MERVCKRFDRGLETLERVWKSFGKGLEMVWKRFGHGLEEVWKGLGKSLDKILDKV